MAIGKAPSIGACQQLKADVSKVIKNAFIATQLYYLPRGNKQKSPILGLVGGMTIDYVSDFP